MNRVAVMALVLAIAGGLSLAGPPKVIPGGPFLSVIGDLAPAAGCLTVLMLGLASIRTARGGAAVGIGLLLLAGTLLLGSILKGVIVFWCDPYARGTLLSG
jgi:hypothetical protein